MIPSPCSAVLPAGEFILLTQPNAARVLRPKPTTYSSKHRYPGVVCSFGRGGGTCLLFNSAATAGNPAGIRCVREKVHLSRNLFVEPARQLAGMPKLNATATGLCNWLVSIGNWGFVSSGVVFSGGELIKLNGKANPKPTNQASFSVPWAMNQRRNLKKAAKVWSAAETLPQLFPLFLSVKHQLHHCHQHARPARDMAKWNQQIKQSTAYLATLPPHETTTKNRLSLQEL